MAAKDFSGVTARLQQELTRDRRAQERDPKPLIRSVQQQIEAIERGDLDAVLTQARPDVVLEIFAPQEFAFIREARGVAELRRALEHNFAAVDDQQPVITNVFADGDMVVLFGREQGRIRATGTHYDVEFVEKFTFRDDRLAAIRIIVADATSADPRR